MKKLLMIIGGIVVGLIVLIIVMLFITSATSNKLVCKSEEGNITIMYNDKTIKGYTQVGRITYDLEQQKKIAEQIGTAAYIEEFTKWFELNTTGSCSLK